MVDIKNDAHNTTGNQDSKSVFVNNNAAVTTVSTSRISKTLKSQDGKIRRSTTVSSRTITRTNNSIGANIHPLNLTGMDSSTVVSAGSGSSPSINNFVGNLNTHGVFGFDAFNQLPTDGDLIKWISDSDSFIKEFNLWSMQNQVAQSGREDTPGCCNDASMQITSEKGLNNQNQDNQVSNVSSENTASGPENIEITHTPILSQKAEASHV